jgi:hypothetical protein
MRLIHSFAILAALGAFSSAFAQASRQPLPGGQKGILTVTVNATGRVQITNSHNERQDWSVNRRAQFQVGLTAQTSSAWDSLAAPPTAPMPAMSASQSQMLAQMQKAMKGCPEDDEDCMVEAAKRAAAPMVQQPQQQAPAQRVPQAMDFTRYQAWAADMAATCSTGTASVDETMEGQGLSDNSGAMLPLVGSRKGEAKLPTGSHDCDTVVSFDRQAGTYNLRIGGLVINVPANQRLHFKSVAPGPLPKVGVGVLEHTNIPLKDEGLLLKDLKGTAAGFTGSTTFTSKGPSERRDGRFVMRTMPNVTTTVEWRFTPQ